ncbi:hypothetical protein K3495_g13629 [Podosphaera aphanis]|nr:hypothetical protein K3495_g13629 [Podosphaera aphanis]
MTAHYGASFSDGGVNFEKSHGILQGGEVYDAEIAGEIMALRAALFTRREGQKIYILLDNQAAVSALRTGRSSSCLRLVRIFQDVARKAKADTIWVAGHSKISGNEEADAETRAALQRLPPRQTQPGYITLACLRRLMHQRRQSLIDDWWSSVCPARYRDLDLKCDVGNHQSSTCHGGYYTN